MPNHRTGHEAGCTAGTPDHCHELLARVVAEVARLREENSDLRHRVRRLEARSGRGLSHPSEFLDVSRRGRDGETA